MAKSDFNRDPLLNSRKSCVLQNRAYSYLGKAEDCKKSNTAELREVSLAACSLQPLPSLCERSNVALAAALRLYSLSCKSLEFFLSVLYWNYFFCMVFPLLNEHLKTACFKLKSCIKTEFQHTHIHTLLYSQP